MRVWFAVILLAALSSCEPVAAAAKEKVLELTIEWKSEADVQVTKVEPKEGDVPVQRGFPQLWRRYFELRNKAGDEGDVHYAAPLVDTTAYEAGKNGAPGSYAYHVIVPDLPDARHLVIVASDDEKGRRVVREQDL